MLALNHSTRHDMVYYYGSNFYITRLLRNSFEETFYAPKLCRLFHLVAQRFPNNVTRRATVNSTLSQSFENLVTYPCICRCTYTLMPPFPLILHCLSIKEFPSFDGTVLAHNGTYVAVVPQQVIVAALWIDDFARSMDSLDCAYPLLPNGCSAWRALPPAMDYNREEYVLAFA